LFVVFGFLVLCALAVHQAGASGKGLQAPADLPLFTDVTEPAGVVHTGDSWGASWGDFDGDGFPDLYAGNHHKPPGLFHNNGDGTFTDIVELTDLNYSLDRHGVAWGDYDNDGDQDLIIAVGARGGTSDIPAELYRNDGHSDFVDIAEEAGVSDDLARGRSVSWADYDRNGDLDFFAANQSREEAPNRLWRNNGDGTFTNVAAEAGVETSLQVFAGGFVDYDRDGWPDIFVLGRVSKCLLYHNNGDGAFEDVSVAAGLASQGGNGYAWGDYDNDGDADLFIGNTGNAEPDHVEIEENEALFIGLAEGDQDGFDLEVAGKGLEFELELKYAGCEDLTCIHLGKDGVLPTEHPFVVGPEVVGTPVYTPGVSLGYYIWQDWGTDLWHVRWSAPELTQFAGIVVAPEPITSVVRVDMEPYIPPSGEAHLWRNEGDGTFTEVSAEANLNALGHYGTANWVDFDNDGWLDLFVVDKGDLQTGNNPNHLFHNNGDGTFKDPTPAQRGEHQPLAAIGVSGPAQQLGGPGRCGEPIGRRPDSGADAQRRIPRILPGRRPDAVRPGR
jgi:hypothetical protein